MLTAEKLSSLLKSNFERILRDARRPLRPTILFFMLSMKCKGLFSHFLGSGEFSKTKKIIEIMKLNYGYGGGMDIIWNYIFYKKIV